MQEPADVPANGGATLAVVTRPEPANVIATCAVPVWPLPHCCTAPETPRIAAITSPRDGVSLPPPAAAAGRLPPPPPPPPPGGAAGVCVEHRSRQSMSPRQRAAQPPPLGPTAAVVPPPP